MKKTILTLMVLMISLWSWAQIVTSNPTTIIQQTGYGVTITFDNSLIPTLNGNIGPLYVHTGVITSVSTTLSDWKNVTTPWPNTTNSALANTTANKLTQVGTTTKWTLTIPDINTYYNLVAGTIVTQLAFVVRTATGAPQSGNIYVDVIQPGVNVSLVTPTNNSLIAKGVATAITANASYGLQTCDIKLFVGSTSLTNITNTTPIVSGTGVKTLTTNYTFNTTDNYYIIAQASANGLSLNDTVKIFVPEAVTAATRPTGLPDGINYIDNSTVTLIMYAPGKSNIFLIGDFNDWAISNTYQLKKDGNYWWITLTGLTPGKLYGFQYLVDGTLRVSDAYTELVMDPWNDKWINEKNLIYPNLKAYPVGKTDGLAATLQTSKTAYNWEIPNFTMPNKENMVIYELLLRDFTPEKSLNAAILKLDYLKNLGITAVELMPIQEFDGNNSWGYNPNNYFAPDKAYGTPDTYKKFIDECHKRGMAVILDMVFNQASGLHPFAMLYWDGAYINPSNQKNEPRPATNNPWMNAVAPHGFSVLNDFNHSFTGTKEYFKRVLQYWITEYKVDGYRMDLTKGFTQNNSDNTYDQSRIDNLSIYNDAVKAVKSDAMFILEHFCTSSEEDNLASKGMYLWRNVNSAYSQAAMGYQSSPSSSFEGMNSSNRKWVGYAESHDEERNFYQAKTYGTGNLKTDSIARVNRVPLNIAFATLIPGPKMIYEFGEMGFDYSINSNGGRTNEKSSVWGWLNLAHRKAAADASAKIITLRKLYPIAFTQGNFGINVAESDWSAGRRISLTHADLNMVVLGNFQTASVTANPNFQKTGTWYNLLTGAELNVSNTQMTITMQAGELLIYTDRKVNLPNGLRDTQIQSDCNIFPTKTNGMVYISTTSTVKNVTVYNMQGLIVKTVTNTSEIDLSNATNGLYILELNTLKGKSQYKIVKE